MKIKTGTQGIILIMSLLMMFSPASIKIHAQVDDLPLTIKCGPFKAMHTQGIAVDVKKRVVYCSFTTMLAKYDYNGNLLGTVTGLLGHLGCLDIDERDGKVYGSLEYKDDVIGQGIMKHEKSDKNFQNNFYVAIIDGDKINRMGMDGGRDGVVKVVSLPTVLDDYSAKVNVGGKIREHRFACSGIDGISFGPRFGKISGKQYLTVAYGVYGDTDRSDNDYQVLLQYDIAKWEKYARPLSKVLPNLRDDISFIPAALTGVCRILSMMLRADFGIWRYIAERNRISPIIISTLSKLRRDPK